MNIEELKSEYKDRKQEIKECLSKFKKIRTHKDIFYELCYCVMTANGSARAAKNAQEQLEKTDFLHTGIIGECVKGVRYPNKKEKYILNNHTKIIADKIDLTTYLSGNIYELREKIANNKLYFKGIGRKESSHFLRNIGFSELAILDRHILKTLNDLDVIDTVPASLTKRRCLEIEEKLKVFCKGNGIPVDEFDILIWTSESGTKIIEAK